MRQQNPFSPCTFPFYLMFLKSLHDKANPVLALEEHHPHLALHLHLSKSEGDDLVAVPLLGSGPLAVSDTEGCLRTEMENGLGFVVGHLL